MKLQLHKKVLSNQMITVISLIIELSLDYKDVIIYASIILRIKSECISTTSNNNLK